MTAQCHRQRQGSILCASHPSKTSVLVFMVQSKGGLLTAVFSGPMVGSSGSFLLIRMSFQRFNDPGVGVAWMSSTTKYLNCHFLPDPPSGRDSTACILTPNPSCQAGHVSFTVVAYLSTDALESLRFSRFGHHLGRHMPASNSRGDSPCDQALTYFLITLPVFRAT